MTSGGTEGETQLLESFHLALEILLDSDKSLVIYVWPKKLAQHSSVQPYGKKHLDESYNKAKKIASKTELLRYVSSAYISEGTKCYMKIYCGHNDLHIILVSDIVKNLHDNQMNLWPETLQAASSMVFGWLLGADTKTFDCDHLTELLRTLPKFANLPVACRKGIVKLNITEKFADRKTAPQGIVILCDGEFLAETNIAMKATFNRSSTKAIAERPDGLHFKYIEYYAEPKSKSPTHKQAAQTLKARVKQTKWMVLSRRVRIDGIQGIDFAIMLLNPASTQEVPLPDTPTTLRQIITNLKCQSYYKYPIFNQIHKQRDKSIMAVCHRDQHSEATMVLGHLPVLLKEQYGIKTKAWFTQQTNDHTKGSALAANARAKGEIIDKNYDGNLDDIDLEDNDALPIKLDMQIMFNTSTLGEGGGFDDGQTVGTVLTGASKATEVVARIQAIGGGLTDTEDEVSDVMKATTSIDSTKRTAATAASMQ
jgi:hypothetical protein